MDESDRFTRGCAVNSYPYNESGCVNKVQTCLRVCQIHYAKYARKLLIPTASRNICKSAVQSTAVLQSPGIVVTDQRDKILNAWHAFQLRSLNSIIWA